MFLVYYISISTVGDFVTGWTNDTLFGALICGNLSTWMTGIGCADWLTGLVVDGIVGGVGAVIGFVPQMLILFFMLSLLEDGQEIWTNLAVDFTQLTAYSFMLFNLLCAPCFAAMGAIKREMNSAKWTWAAIGYMCGFAYSISLIVYQLGMLLTGNGFNFGTIAALLLLSGLLYLLLRKNKGGCGCAQCPRADTCKRSDSLGF